MADLVTEILAHFTTLAGDYGATSSTLAQFGASDEAKAVDACRAMLKDRITAVERQYEYLTVAQYAALHRVSELTVRRWCDRGELAAESTAKGWKIKRTAIRERR